jgi:hypothetical protein
MVYFYRVLDKPTTALVRGNREVYTKVVKMNFIHMRQPADTSPSTQHCCTIQDYLLYEKHCKAKNIKKAE